MITHQFQKIEAWKRSLDLSVQIIKNAESIKNYALKDQISRSAISIPSNIAEGSQRNSNPDFSRFLHIAKGSAAELFTQILIAKELKYLDEELADSYLKEIEELSSMIHGLIKYLKSK